MTPEQRILEGIERLGQDLMTAPLTQERRERWHQYMPGTTLELHRLVREAKDATVCVDALGKLLDRWVWDERRGEQAGCARGPLSAVVLTLDAAQNLVKHLDSNEEARVLRHHLEQAARQCDRLVIQHREQKRKPVDSEGLSPRKGRV